MIRESVSGFIVLVSSPGQYHPNSCVKDCGFVASSVFVRYLCADSCARITQPIMLGRRQPRASERARVVESMIFVSLKNRPRAIVWLVLCGLFVSCLLRYQER
jgi:hypothetical protein